MSQQLLDGSEEVLAKPGGFGVFESSKDGKDEWLTPPEIIRALGEFDLDPCAPRNPPWQTAKKQYSVLDGGLTKPWEGRVWLNPPYGAEAIKWVGRLAAHGNGIALICARTETQMFFEHVWNVCGATGIFFFKGRLTFYHVTGEKADNCIGAPSCLVIYGRDNLRAVEAAMRTGKLKGTVIDLYDIETHV